MRLGPQAAEARSTLHRLMAQKQGCQDEYSEEAIAKAMEILERTLFAVSDVHLPKQSDLSNGQVTDFTKQSERANESGQM